MNKKEMSLGAILSFASQVINILVGVVFTPIMIRILGQSEYGLYQLVLSVVNYLTLMNLGFNGAYIRYYSLARMKGENEVSNINGMFLSIFCIIGALCLAAGVVLYQNIHIFGTHLTASDYATAKRLLVLMVVNLAISFPNSLFVAYMFANERFVFFRGIGILTSILLPALKIPLLLLGYGSVGIVVAILLVTILQLVLHILYCLLRLKMRITLGYFDKRLFADLMQFTFFIFLSDMVDQLNSNVDKLLLGRMIGTISVAIYSVAYNLQSYYTTITWIVPEVYVPAVNRTVIEENSMLKANALFVKTGRVNNILTLLIISGFFVFGQTFIQLWVGMEYTESFYATIILMMSGYIPAVQTLGVNIQNAKKMHQMRSVVYFGIACINIVSSVFLIHRWGVVGTCLGTLFASLVGHGIFMNVYYQKRIGLDIRRFWKELMHWYPYVAIMTIIAYFIVNRVMVARWIPLIIAIAVYTCIYFTLVLAVGLKEDERELLLVKLKTFRNR